MTRRLSRPVCIGLELMQRVCDLAVFNLMIDSNSALLIRRQ